MKIHLDNVNLHSSTGPNTFGKRLATALHDRGHVIADPTDNYDVMLSFIERTRQHHSDSRFVQRLDGIWFKPENFELNNRSIKSSYENADLVIWQSGFDQQMIIHHWGVPTAGIVIPNGIDTTPVPAITIPSIQGLRDQYDMLFVCSSNWHPQKRLRDNVELFCHLRSMYHPNSALIVMGRSPDYAVSLPYVYYTGSLPHDVCAQVFVASDWMIHLAWLDHCPNVVIESLVQGTPVICTDQGGTKELVGAHGIVLNETPYNFQLTDYDDPPRVDITQIKEPLPDRTSLGPHVEIDIKTVAERYERAFMGLLEEK